jgi:DNA recombination protein RmuC
VSAGQALLWFAAGAALSSLVAAFLGFRLAMRGERARSTLAAELAAAKAETAARSHAFDEARERLGDTFAALSSAALERSSRSFLELAAERTREIDTLVKPLRDSLQQVDTRIGELEKARAEAYGSLSEQLRTLAGAHQQLQLETGRLVQALRAPGVGGRWGEIQLRRVVELAGMAAHCDFFEQAAADAGERRLRPDMLVRLPNGRAIIVDAKAPLQAYLQAHDASDDATRAAALEQHAAQIRAHARALAQRAYQEHFEGSAEFVVLFLPGEAFYTAAVERDPSLMESIVEQRVLLATPMTLIALLKAVAYGWRQEAVARDAREVSRLGGELYERIRTMAGHFGELRRSLDRSVDAYNRAVGSMERMVLPSARRFRDLGAAAGDEIATLEPIDHAARSPQAPELLAQPDQASGLPGPGPSVR